MNTCHYNRWCCSGIHAGRLLISVGAGVARISRSINRRPHTLASIAGDSLPFGGYVKFAGDADAAASAYVRRAAYGNSAR